MEHGPYTHAIDSFNYFLLYILMFDFTIKYIAKQSQSMQIAPYLTFPVKRNRLFNFLLVKEFPNIWNLYFFFLLLPFVFKSVTPYHGFPATILYILFFYLACICNSLLVNIANNLLNRNGWFLPLPFLLVAAVFALTLIPGVEAGDYGVKAGEWILSANPVAWGVVLLVFVLLWRWNLRIMRHELYCAMQGKKISEGRALLHLPFIDKLGTIGMFINLDVKMILRSKRLKRQMYVGVFFIFYYFFIFSNPAFRDKPDILIFFTIFVYGWLGMIMGQYLFTSESSFFDGLMTRDLSLLDILKGKYILYVCYGILMFLLTIPLVFIYKAERSTGRELRETPYW